MSALPANESDYTVSPSKRSPVRPDAEVISLPRRRGEHQTTPDQDRDEPAEIRASKSGLKSGPDFTVSDFPGDWASVTAVWTDSPEPLRELVGRVTAVRRDPTPVGVGMAVWSALVLIPRGLFHLASWALTHPLRILAVAVLAAVLLATL